MMKQLRYVCSKCGRRIKYIRTANKKLMPVDFDPVPFWQNENGKGRIITASGTTMFCDLEGAPNTETGYGYMTHFATCPAAQRARRDAV